MRRAPALALAPLALLPLPVAAEPLLELPLRVRVAECAGQPVKPPGWIAAHVAAANRVLRPHGVRLATRLDRFRPPRCGLTGRDDRHALARFVDTQEVTVLVLERVRDLDLTTYDLMGVHWRYEGSDAALAGRRWIFLTARAEPPVLAHELGHYFGLAHDPRGGNLMTPGPSAPIWRRPGRKPLPFAPRFTAAQGRRVRKAVAALLAR